jgi:hypothetical protein
MVFRHEPFVRAVVAVQGFLDQPGIFGTGIESALFLGSGGRRGRNLQWLSGTGHRGEKIPKTRLRCKAAVVASRNGN